MHKGEEQLAELLDASEDAWAPWSACGRVFVLALDSIFLLMQSLGNSSDGSCCHVGELNSSLFDLMPVGRHCKH